MKSSDISKEFFRLADLYSQSFRFGLSLKRKRALVDLFIEVYKIGLKDSLDMIEGKK